MVMIILIIGMMLMIFTASFSSGVEGGCRIFLTQQAQDTKQNQNDANKSQPNSGLKDFPRERSSWGFALEIGKLHRSFDVDLSKKNT